MDKPNHKYSRLLTAVGKQVGDSLLHGAVQAGTYTYRVTPVEVLGKVSFLHCHCP